MSRITGSLDEGRITFVETGMRVFDPVCGMELDRMRAAGMTDYEERRYFFCSESCKERFDADPATFVHPDHQPSRHHP